MVFIFGVEIVKDGNTLKLVDKEEYDMQLDDELSI